MKATPWGSWWRSLGAAFLAADLDLDLGAAPRPDHAYIASWLKV